MRRTNGIARCRTRAWLASCGNDCENHRVRISLRTTGTTSNDMLQIGTVDEDQTDKDRAIKGGGNEESIDNFAQIFECTRFICFHFHNLQHFRDPFWSSSSAGSCTTIVPSLWSMGLHNSRAACLRLSSNEAAVPLGLPSATNLLPVERRTFAHRWNSRCERRYSKGLFSCCLLKRVSS